MTNGPQAKTITTTIAEGASLSSVIDLGDYTNIAIGMPAAWDAADLTFQGCGTSDGTFVNILDNNDAEVTGQASTSRIITGLSSALAAFRFIKIRSGVAASAVNQTAARTLSIFLK